MAANRLSQILLPGGRARRLVRCHLLGDLELAAVLQIRCNPCRAKGVIADLCGDPAAATRRLFKDGARSADELQ